MDGNPPILVLGAYGLAGRAIVERILAKTHYPVLAAGRNPELLQSLQTRLDNGRVRTLTMDAADDHALREACSGASFVINAVGPYARSGAAIAQTAMACGRPYLDCANEQVHYHRLKELDAAAREKGVPMITGAGAIPGFSTLLIGYLLERFPPAREVDCCWAQFRHAYADSGLASMMGGILEALHEPVAIRNGAPEAVVLGRSARDFALPVPFGPQRLLELPTIDALTLPVRFPLREFHNWFYMGDLPTWLLGIIRFLQPQRRDWAYRLLEDIMRRINNRDTAKAIAAGIGPEALLMVSAYHGQETKTCQVLFKDGAAATACLPAHLATLFLQGHCTRTGLLTPLDLLKLEAVLADSRDVVIRADLSV